MLAMQTANEYGLLDNVCAPYHHRPVCYHQQSSSSSCSWSWSSQDFSNRWVLDGGAPDTQQSLLQDHDHDQHHQRYVFHSHNNSLFLCQDHGHCQGGWQTNDEDHHDDLLQFWYCGERNFFSSKLLEFLKSVSAVLSLSSTHLHKTESSKSSKMCGSLLACLVIAAASFTSW